MRNLWMCVLAGIMLTSVGPAKAADDLKGFELDSSFVEARRNAESNGWSLQPLSSELPHQWVVRDTNFRLFVCEDRVASILTLQSGGLDDFAALVMRRQIEMGDPRTQIVSFMAGSKRISTITSRFSDAVGREISLQLTSIAGVPSISTNYASNTPCPEEK
ncbi:hypothetical protein A6U98_35160 [Rhizobium sp. WYCCWR10014]|nr:hypothetical protein A6U98_35160 [Rhizobium sp. WYCCWR10014]